MARETAAAERGKAVDDRRAAAYWEAVAKRDPGQSSIALGNARDLRAEARLDDQAAERQENARKRHSRSRGP